MNVLDIPFNKFLGIQNASGEMDAIFKLELKKEYHNHLGTLHASALFALAEATSGQFLLNQFKDIQVEVIPVVRKVEVKFSKPALSIIFSKANLIDTNVPEVIHELETKKRAMIKVKVELFDDSNDKLFTSIFEWFIALK